MPFGGFSSVFSWVARGWPDEPPAAPSAAPVAIERASYRYDPIALTNCSKPNARAVALLMGLLDEEQRESVKQYGYFQVRGSAGGVYQISCHGSGIVHWRDRQRCIYRAGCILINDASLPPTDQAIGLLLMVRADEPFILRTAHFAPLQGRGTWS